MDAKEEIERLKSSLVALRESGRKTVPIEVLQTYLAQLELGTAQSLEAQRLELQKALAHSEATNRFNLEVTRSANEAGREALNASLLINGGAVVAILSFLGATVNKGVASALGLALTKPLFMFGSGVLLGLYRFLCKRSFGLRLRESALEADRKLVQCGFPVAYRHRPFFADVA